jgi:pimeloyl-ACP methyl ester carboxylesterase
MLKIDQINPFRASWNQNNESLNPNSGGFLWRLAKKVKNLILYIPNSIVAVCINPRSESKFRPSSEPLSYRNFSKEIITPDQIRISAEVHIADGATRETPTILLFNPLGTNHSVHHELGQSLKERKCNVIRFDYRGLGNTWRAEDLVVDGESVYQYATQELGIERNKVHFYGFSLGGAIAAQVKSLHPESEGKYVGDRSFRSLFSLITEKCSVERFGVVIKKISSIVIAILIAYPIYLLGWEWDGSKAIAQHRGERRMIYHPNDYLVPFEANLASLCPAHERISLNQNATGPSTHFASLDAHDTAEGIPAIDVIADFYC